MGAFAYLSLAAFGAAFMAVAAFLMGHNKNIQITNENAKDAAIAYDRNAKPEEVIICANNSCAIARCKSGGFLFFQALGDRIAVREIKRHQLILGADTIKIDIEDFGFLPVIAHFNTESMAKLAAGVND